MQSKIVVLTFGCKATQTFVQNFGESLCLIMSVEQDFCAKVCDVKQDFGQTLGVQS